MRWIVVWLYNLLGKGKAEAGAQQRRWERAKSEAANAEGLRLMLRPDLVWQQPTETFFFKKETKQSRNQIHKRIGARP